MYLWKCWRETRAFCIVFLIIAAAAMPVPAALAEGTQLVEQFGAGAFQAAMALILNGVAVGLGAISALHEFDDDTIHFLFTKPRSRAFFFWGGWVVGCAELLVVGFVNVLSGWLTLSRHSRHPFTAEVFAPLKAQQFVEVIVYSMFFYTLTYALTAVFRNGLKGLGASLGVMLGAPGVAIAARLRWNVRLPIPVNQIGGLPWGASGAAWLLIALCVAYGAQMVVERAEV